MPSTPQLGLAFSLLVTIGGTKTVVAGRTNVDLTRTAGIVDTSHAGDFGWSSGIPGPKGWSLDATVVSLIDAATGSYDASQQAIITAWENGETLQAVFRLPGQDGTAGKVGKTGACFITNIKQSGQFDARTEMSVSLSGNGALIDETAA